MATNFIAAVPHDLEPLPRYTRDPETSSVTSVAPSYTSEVPHFPSSIAPIVSVSNTLHQAPSYHSTHPENPNQTPATTSSNASSTSTPRRTITFHMNIPSQSTGHRTPTSGTRTPQAQTAAQRHRVRHTMESEIHSLAARMLRPAHPSRITFPDSAGFVNEAKARKAYIRELREEAALREKGKMWGYCVGQIRGREEREKVWQGKSGGAAGGNKGWKLGVRI